MGSMSRSTGHRGLVAMLLQTGADTNATDEDGKTALVLAEENGCIILQLPCNAMCQLSIIANLNIDQCDFNF